MGLAFSSFDLTIMGIVLATIVLLVFVGVLCCCCIKSQDEEEKDAIRDAHDKNLLV
jgi:hypothetical protein